MKRDRVGVIGQAVELALVGHVAQRERRHVRLEVGEHVGRRDVVERREESGRGPGRQPVLADIGDVGRRAAAEAQHQAVLVVRPGVVGDLDLDAGIRRLELAGVVLDRVERVVPDGEFERDVFGRSRLTAASCSKASAAAARSVLSFIYASLVTW